MRILKYFLRIGHEHDVLGRIAVDQLDGSLGAGLQDCQLRNLGVWGASLTHQSALAVIGAQKFFRELLEEVFLGDGLEAALLLHRVADGLPRVHPLYF